MFFIIIRGPLGIGKTTIAKVLANNDEGFQNQKLDKFDSLMYFLSLSR